VIDETGTTVSSTLLPKPPSASALVSQAGNLVTLWTGDSVMILREGDDEHAIQLSRFAGGYKLEHGGAQVVLTVRAPHAASLAELMPKKAAADTSKMLLCPMPGLVVSVNVAVDQDVKTGETLAVVEAMKMENVLVAERDGKIKKINVKKGDNLALDDVILEFV